MNGWGILLFFVVMSLILLLPVRYLIKVYFASFFKLFKVDEKIINNISEITDKFIPIYVVLMGIICIIVYISTKSSEILKNLPYIMATLVAVAYPFWDNFQMREMSKKTGKKLSFSYLSIRFIVFLILAILLVIVIKHFNLW